MLLRLLLVMALAICVKFSIAQVYITEDAERFAEILNSSPNSVSKKDIKTEYLKPGTEGIKIFTPMRIRNASNMAKMVNKYRSAYEKGVNLMLPAALQSAEQSAEVLRKIQSLLGQKESAPVYVVFGGNNSGGTASKNGLVIGLEVLGRFAETEEEAKNLIKSFIAHEIVHVYQSRSGNKGRGTLLYQSLREGFADFIENMVMEGVSNAERDRHTYGLTNEKQLWFEFKMVMNNNELSPWMYGKGKDGRPSDLGYWIGKRICEAYYNQAEDKSDALIDLLLLENPKEILMQSGYTFSPNE